MSSQISLHDRLNAAQRLLRVFVCSAIFAVMIMTNEIKAAPTQDFNDPTLTGSTPIPQQSMREIEQVDASLFADAFAQQQEILSALEPSDFVLAESTGRLVRLQHGFRDISDLTYQPGDDWQPILDLIAQLVPFTGNEALVFERSSRINGEERPIYVFSQTIDGIPVQSSILKIEVSTTTGEILHVYSSLVADKKLARANIGAEEAIRIARYQAREKGIPEHSAHTKPELYYVRTPLVDETKLFWIFGFGNYHVEVNAASGKASIRSPFF